MNKKKEEPQYLDLGAFGKVAAGSNVGDKGIPDGSLPGGWMVASGTLYAPNQKRDLVASEYGWAASFLDHKELGPILLNAAKNGWTEQKLLTEIRKTDWWKATSLSKREWLSLKSQDPAEADKQLNQAEDVVRNVASQVGGVLDDGVIADFAERAKRNGWIDMNGNVSQDLTNAVTMELMRDGQKDAVRSGVIGRTMRSQASSMGIPLSDKTLNKWIKTIARGNATMEDFNNYTRNQAKGLYTALADDIDKGLSVQDLAEPYAQSAARVLGVTAEQIDFSSAKWNKALNFVDDKGKRRTMTLAEWENELRSNDMYGYTQTEEATNKAYALADAIAQMFGKV